MKGRWIVEMNPMGLGLWQPAFGHWFRWAARRRAQRMARNYSVETRVVRGRIFL